MKLNKISNILYLFGNDLRMLHLNCVGKDFLYVHKELNDFYDEVFDFYDTVAESALTQLETISNPSDLILDTKWESVQGNEFTFDDVLDIVNVKGNQVLNAIADVDKDVYPSHIYSMLDNVSEYIDKEVNYKFGRSAK